MKNLCRRMAVAISLFAVVAILSPVAKADDYKVFPGSLCQRENPTNYGNGAAPLFSLLSGAYLNKSTVTSTGSVGGWEHVLCPITRDQFRNTSGLKNLMVRLYNTNIGGRGFKCDLASYNKFGGAGTNPTDPSFPGNALSFAAFTVTAVGFQDFPLKVNTSVLGGYYILHCEVPPQSYLYSYQIQEVPNTDAN